MSDFLGFINNTHINSSSNFEKIGDFFLTPSRTVFGGKKFVYLEKNGEKLRYESPQPEKAKWVKTALRIVAVLGLLLIPLGLLFKAVSLINKQPRQTYSDWTKPQACTKNKDDLVQLFVRCRDNHLLKELFFEIVSHPERYLNKIPGEPSLHTYEPLGFTECACNNQAFDRFKSPRRVNLENLEEIIYRCFS